MPASGLISMPMNRKWYVPEAVWIAPPLWASTTIWGIFGLSDGFTRLPSRGRLPIAEDWRMIQPVPAARAGSVNGPGKLAPACKTMR